MGHDTSGLVHVPPVGAAAGERVLSYLDLKRLDRGYALITVTPDRWTTEFRVVDVKVARAAVTTDFTGVVAAREPVTLPAGPTTEPPPTAVPATPVDGTATFTG